MKLVSVILVRLDESANEYQNPPLGSGQEKEATTFKTLWGKHEDLTRALGVMATDNGLEERFERRKECEDSIGLVPANNRRWWEAMQV